MTEHTDPEVVFEVLCLFMLLRGAFIVLFVVFVKIVAYCCFLLGWPGTMRFSWLELCGLLLCCCCVVTCCCVDFSIFR